jgi:hypothetical protein
MEYIIITNKYVRDYYFTQNPTRVNNNIIDVMLA